MRKAWCDICGKELEVPEDIGIGKLKMDSSYVNDTVLIPLHKSLDACNSCLIYVDAAIEAYKKIVNTKIKEEF